MAEEQTLNDCGCCKGITKLTPRDLANPPGLSALACRVGTHGSFKTSMLAGLAGPGGIPALTTRSNDDPAIALLDATAGMLDVLTFYRERIANEGYLRTATERMSVLELARTISYELKPGVAASTWLAFEMETAPGAPSSAIIPVGTKVQSLPGQDEKPQTFETVEQIEARPAWNRLSLKVTQSQKLGADTDRVYLKTLTTQVQKGNALLFVSTKHSIKPNKICWALRMVNDVELDVPNDRTLVFLDRILGKSEPTVSSKDAPMVYLLRLRAALFGHNAPDWKTMSKEIRCAYDPSSCSTSSISVKAEIPQPATDWPGIDAISGKVIDLDATYPGIVPGGWLVLEKPDTIQLYNIEEVSTPSVSKFAMSAKVTRVTPDTNESLKDFDVRETTVYAQSERAELAVVAITKPLAGDILTLSSALPDLPIGRQLLVTGMSMTGEQTGETVTVQAVNGSLVTLKKPLRNSYNLPTVTIYANVATATHGETRHEVLGSGDAARGFQKFMLRQKPLTYISAPTANGATSTMQVRVNDVLWQETPTLYDLPSREHDYSTRLDDDGNVTVTFGDGVNGARLPTGDENILASYRTGIGKAGMVKAGQLSLLMTRPLGVQKVTNPLEPTGAADPESRDQARQNAPVTVLTLDRIVSLRDFEDFARSFAGIGKAQATWLWDGEQRIVHLTIAAATNNGTDCTVDPQSTLFKHLCQAMDSVRDTIQRLEVASYEPILFRLKARVMIDKTCRAEKVLADVSTTLKRTYSFEQREFGQPLHKSEVLAVIQSVEGVTAVFLDHLYLRGAPAGLQTLLLSSRARRNKIAAMQETVIKPAQLLLLDPSGIDVTEEIEK